MAKNKTQKAAEERAAKAAQTPTQTAEAERTREGSDNPAAVQEKMDAVAAQPKPDGKATPAPATPAPVAAANKQQVTLDKLKEAWTAKGVDLSKLEAKPDGKFLLVTVAAGWPIIQLGPTGGIVLPQIRSYAKAWDAAVDGLAVFTKQNERDAKKAAAAAPPAPKAPAAEKQLQTA